MKEVIKKADTGGEDSGSMDPEFVAERQKMINSGKTEGEAILVWLDKNQKKNKPKEASALETKKLSQTLGRPL